MRLLLIEEDERRCDDFRQRLASWRPEAELVVRDPVAQGRLPLEFLAQGYDAVLLSDEWSGGGGLVWAKELAGRSGFAPLILLSGRDAAAYEAIPFGVQLVVRDDPSSDKLIEVLAAAEQRQSFARAVWRTSVAGRDSQRFGGAFIRGYRHIRRIATGTVSDLYLGESEAAGELVALKVARDRHAEQGDLDDSFRRFLQEYEIVQRIRSKGVVRLYDLGVSDEHAWLVMEYFAAGDLRARMRAGLSVRRALYNSISIARALQAIHAAGVLHRDLKPGNVMLRNDGSIALIDFGLSKDAALARDDTDRGMIFGTPHYMSPEQGHGEPIDARSDLYSLGIILFEMLAREKPYKAENPMALIYKHRKEPVPRLPAAFERAASGALQPIIDRLLAKLPEDRYADAGEAATALEGAFRQVLKSEVEV
jgi:tRNA A-37 threonylcarbamoyl transferase component Bud32